MIVLANAEVAELLPMAQAIEVVADVMRTVSAGEATMPLRTAVPLGGANLLGVMPGALPGPAGFGAKLVCLFPDNPASGRSSHQGALIVFEPEHGAPAAMMNADLVTAIRTAAASAVATRALARPDAATLALIGHGEQAWHHLAAMRAVRPIREVRVAGRDAARATRFATLAAQAHPELAFSAGDDVRAAVDGADLVCTVTSAAEPVLFGAWVAPGAHVNVVGASVASKREVDGALMQRAEVFCDFRPSVFAQAGEIIALIESGDAGEDIVRAEIGEVLSGRRPGRGGDEAVTVYRSLGVIAQDLACAAHLLGRAQAEGRGTTVGLD